MQEGFKIFTDFDGTITTEDVGDAVFRKFGDKTKVDAIIHDLLSDRLPARESWIALCSSVDTIDEAELDKYINTFQVDPGFKSFVEFCREFRHDLFILSDGFDYYIEKILKKEGIEGVTIYSNHLVIEKNKLIPSFPYYDSGFLTSANCKRNHIISNSSDDDFTFYIGDGNSDKDTAQYCDFIFAKSDLLKFCEKERITYFPFQSFSEIKERMKELMSRKRLHKRYRAGLKRKTAYIAE